MLPQGWSLSAYDSGFNCCCHWLIWRVVALLRVCLTEETWCWWWCLLLSRMQQRHWGFREIDFYSSNYPVLLTVIGDLADWLIIYSVLAPHAVEYFQALDCTGTDNQKQRNKTLHGYLQPKHKRHRDTCPS